MKKTEFKCSWKPFKKNTSQSSKFRKVCPNLQSQKKAYTENLNQINQQLSKQEELLKSIEEYQQEKAGREVSLQQLEMKNNELRQHLIAFKNAGPECPFCAQPLTKAHRQKYESLVSSEGVERKIKIDEHKEKIQELSNKINASRRELAELKQLEKEQKLLQQRITEIETIIKSHHDTLASWGEEKAGLLNSVPQILKKESFAKDERDELVKLRPQVDALSYDQNAHQQLREQEKELRAVEEKYNELEKARSIFNPA